MAEQVDGECKVDSIAPREAPSTVTCLVNAFWEYPETVHLLPRSDTRRRVLPRYLASDARDSAQLGALHAVRRGVRIVGVAAWTPPGGYPVGFTRQVREVARLAPIAPWGLRALREARAGQAANRSHHVGQPPHWWLRAIGVDPSEQGHGIGSLLVSHGLRLADQAGTGCFLFTATAENAAWYTTFGFETLAEYRPTPSWPHTWAMWRPPRATPERSD